MIKNEQLTVEQVLAEAADFLDGYAGGHHMAKSCATALRDEGLALEISDRLQARPDTSDVERDIRIAIWNGGRWQGSTDEVAQSLVRKVMDEPTMRRALAALNPSPAQEEGREQFEPVGGEAERAQIVAWLRAQLDPSEQIDDRVNSLIDAIDRGDHLTAGGEG